MTGRVDGKIALITGGAQGLGEAAARMLAKEGARVAIADLNGEAAQKLAKDIDGIAVRTDVSNGTNVKALVKAVNDKWGGIDLLVNNAGIGHKPQPLDALAEDAFDRILAVNAKSVYFTAREIVPLMKAKKRGAIVNVASTGGVSPRPNLTWYNASKGWMITATRAMAVELAPFGIRVNAISPGLIHTPML